MTDPNKDAYAVTVTEKGAVLYTGQAISQMSAMMLASVTCMSHGVFSMEPAIVNESDDLLELTYSFGGRTLGVLIESQARVAARTADKAAFDNIVSGYETS